MRIFAGQVGTFEQAAWRRFEREMVEHSKEFAPMLSEALGEEQLLIAVRSTMSRAWSYGFTNRGPIRLFLELALLCGSGFDTDPQYPFAAKALEGQGDQMMRAEELHEGHNAYLKEVSGPEAIHERRALRELASLAGKPLPLSMQDLDAELRDEFDRIFAQKARYVGEAGITAVLEEAKGVAAAHGFHEVRGIALIVALLFSFGHACPEDPLFPWVSATLRDESIPTGAARASRLEMQALAWLMERLPSEGVTSSS